MEVEEILSRQVYDPQSKVISFLSRRATDSITNAHVFLPRAATLKKETSIQ